MVRLIAVLTITFNVISNKKEEVIMKKEHLIIAMVMAMSFLEGCGAINDMKGIMTGTSKPEVSAIAPADENVPESMICNEPYDKVYTAAVKVCQTNGGIFEESKDAGRIETEERSFRKGSFFQTMVLIKPEYNIKEYITLKKVKDGAKDGVSVSYKARFTRVLSGMLSTGNQQYPEAEKEARATFFASLKKEL